MRIMFVVEGPAGAGKTTLINSIIEQIPDLKWISAPLTRPRSYDGFEGEMMAIVKDQTHIQLTFRELERDVIVDRWALSSWVYNTIRQGLLFDNVQAAEDRLASFLRLTLEGALVIKNQLRLRGIQVADWAVIWLVFMPPPEVIKERRLKSLREFPYDHNVEYGYYEWAIEHFPKGIGWVINQVTGVEDAISTIHRFRAKRSGGTAG